MNWDAISAIAETVGTIAVLATLVYLTVQIKTANNQREIEALRHNWDGLNRICELLGESPERASIILRGRESLENLSDEERMVFEFIHLRILNTIEGWYLQLMQTSPHGEYRDQQLRNIAGVIVFMFDYQGAQDAWNSIKHMFEPIESLFDEAISSAKLN
jgi:hypothetical protein